MSVCIKARRRGPLVLEGPCDLIDVNGQPIDLAGRKQVLLCRCGASRTTPLCDGSHNRIGFQPESEREPEPA